MRYLLAALLAGCGGGGDEPEEYLLRDICHYPTVEAYEASIPKLGLCRFILLEE